MFSLRALRDRRGTTRAAFMNYRLVFNQLGLLLLVLSVILLLMAGGFFVIEYVLQHKVDGAARAALLISGGIGLIAGVGLWFFTRIKEPTISRREALLLVGMTWVLGAAFAGLPYFFWANLSRTVPADHPFLSYTNCYFEAMSGLTTAGASVLTEIEAVPRSLLLWRALTQWLGGLGIVVLFVAVLPALGTSARKLFRAETSGITKQGMRPQIRDTARTLWYIYLGLTLAEIILLRLAGMDWYDAICHTFTTLATGGFSTKNASIAAYDSAIIETIIILFMIMGGVNFALYYQAFRGRFGNIAKDPELRLYLSLLAIGAALAAVLMYGKPIATLTGQIDQGTWFNSIRHGIFDVVSLVTTTGYATAEYDDWHGLARTFTYLLVFVGGCAGSTAGGFKVIRLWIVIKTLHAEIERAFRPSVIRPIRVGETTIGEDLRLATLAFGAGFLVVLTVCASALIALESSKGIDMASAVTGVLACMSTTGPGLGMFGGGENYGWLSAPSKWVLCFAMVVGRLEVFTILVLFSPRFWRGR